MTTIGARLFGEGAGCLAFVVAVGVAADGPLLTSPVRVGAAAVVVAALVGVAVSFVQHRAGRWAPAPWVALPAVAVPVAAAVSGPAMRAGLLAAPPLTIAAVSWWQRRRAGNTTVPLVMAASVAVVIVDLLFRDPYRELMCRPVCPVSPWVVHDHPDLVAAAGGVLVVGVVIVSISMARTVASSHDRRAGASVVVAIVVMAASALGHVVRSRVAPTDQLASALVSVQLVGVAVLAAVELAPVLRAHRDRRRIHEWMATVERTADVPGAVELLRRETGDPELRVLGVDHRLTQPGLALTTVRRDGRDLAVVEHRVESVDRVRAAISPTLVALLENELLVAESARQLAEMQASRRLAIERVDHTRRQLQRDLHDGAQQHLIALGMTVSSLASEGSDADEVDEDEDRALFEQAAVHATSALDRLRAIAHASAPPLLDDAGLVEAVRSLAEFGPIHLDVEPIGAVARLPGDVERAAYHVVAEAVERAALVGADAARVVIDHDHDHNDDDLTVTVTYRTTVAEVASVAVDRVDAVGGQVVSSVDAGLATVHARFPG